MLPPTLTVAGLALLFWMQGFEDLDAALAAARARRPLTGKVSAALAQDAVDELDEARGTRLRNLVAVARAGKADKGVAAVLLNRLVDEADPDGAILEALNTLPPAVRDPLAKKTPRLRQALTELVTAKKGGLPTALARLYVRYQEPRQVAELLGGWAAASPVPSGYLELLRALPFAPKPRQLLRELIPATVPAEQEALWVWGIGHVLAGHDGALKDALDLLDGADLRHRARVMGAIGYQPVEGHDDEEEGGEHDGAHDKLLTRVRRHITHGVKEGSGALKARAIEGAQRQRLHALLPNVIHATTSEDERVQRAAIAALPALLRASFEAERSRKQPDPKRLQAVKERVEAAAEQALQSAKGEARVAALLTARQLGMREALRKVVADLAADAGTAKSVRLAALRCFGGTLPRNAKTVDLLLKLMQGPDRELATGAWRALQSVARARLPFRMELWRSWRARQKLE